MGKVVLLQRGTCDFGLKAQLAGEAGAIGAVIFNEGTIGQADRNDVLIPTLAGYASRSRSSARTTPRASSSCRPPRRPAA